MTVAIFDLDYTLLDGDTEALWSRFLFEKGWVARAFVERIEAYYRDYESGGLDFRAYEEFLLGSLAALAWDDFLGLREEFLHERISPLIRPPMLEVLGWHRGQGHTPLLLTASNHLLVEPIAGLLHIPNCLCTRAEIRDGKCTGRIVGIPAFQEGKATLLKDWLAAHRHTLEESWAYSDSHNDLPLLNLAAHAVAAYPDARLRSVAQSRAWKIIG